MQIATKNGLNFDIMYYCTCGIRDSFWHQGDSFDAEGLTQSLDLGSVINLGSGQYFKC